MQRDMTQGSVWKHILFFSLPIMLGNLLQQLYNTVDGIVVGNYVSQDALAAVGSCASLVFLFLAISIGMGNGGGVMVAQFYGAGRMEEMRRAVSTLLIILVAMGLILSLVGVIFAHGLIVNVMQVKDPDIKDMAVTYFRIYCAGLLFQYLYNAIASILRALGDSKATLYFLCIAALLNIVLDLFFVISLKMSVFGVGLATVIAQVICAGVSLIYMLRRYPVFRFRKGEFVFDRHKFVIALRLGIPASIQQAVVSLGNVFIQRLVNSFGGATMAAYTVGNRLENYTLLPILSINAGVATFTGQNVGAGRFDRAKKGFWTSILLSLCTVVILCPLLYIFATPLSQLFGTEGEGLRQSVEMIHFMSAVFFLFALYNPSSGMLQGAGDALWSTGCTLITLGVRVAMAYILVYAFDFGYNAAWIPMPFGWICAAIVAYLRFLSGKWMGKAIVKSPEAPCPQEEEI